MIRTCNVSKILHGISPVHEDMNVKTCQIVVSALLGNLSAFSDDLQESTAKVRTARAMLINFVSRANII